MSLNSVQFPLGGLPGLSARGNGVTDLGAIVLLLVAEFVLHSQSGHNFTEDMSTYTGYGLGS